MLRIIPLPFRFSFLTPFFYLFHATFFSEAMTEDQQKHHKRSFTGFTKEKLEEELAQVPSEQKAAWEKYTVPEGNGNIETGHLG
jgi:hypothetical protein